MSNATHHSFIQEDLQNRKLALSLESYIVEAPAGAGKTELLTQRFLRLMTEVEAPEEIIAITFTNKAASEMRERILSSLHLALAPDAPDIPHKKVTYDLAKAALAHSHQFNWKLLETPSRLRIFTIDALCGHLARQMPLLSRLGAQPGITEDAKPYYIQAVLQVLEDLDHPDHGADIQTVLRYFDNDTEKLCNLLCDMLAKRDQWLGYTQETHDHDTVAKALEYLVSREILEIADTLDEHLQKTLMPIARYAAEKVEKDHPIAALSDWDNPLIPDIHQLDCWQAVASLLITEKGEWRKRLDKTIGLPAEEDSKRHKVALSSIIENLSLLDGTALKIARLKQLPRLDETPLSLIQVLAKLLNLAAAHLWLVFRQHGVVDFVEIAKNALLALHEQDNPTELAMKLDYRIRHLLVDEFQDTSPTQIRLLQALTNGWQSGDGRTLFCVGDPMQSIYRFRKANVGLFLKVAHEGIGAVSLSPLKLWQNNRSAPEVVSWVNTTFLSIFPPEDNSLRGAIRYRSFVATQQSNPEAGIFVYPMVAPAKSQEINDENEEIFSSDFRKLEARKMIACIQQIRAHSPESTIAVLVRARNHLQMLVSELRRFHSDISFQAIDIEPLAQRQVIQDLMSLTYALHRRADRLHWAALLRAPWCGITLADLEQILQHDSDATIFSLMHDHALLSQLSDDGRLRIQHVLRIMEEAFHHQGRQPTRDWIYSVWRMLGGPQCLWESSDIQDVDAYFNLIDDLEYAGYFHVEQLAEGVNKLFAAPDPSADAKLQFMTIHKSKGLEFDHILLPGLDCRTRQSEQSLILWEEITDELDHNRPTRLIAAPYIPQHHKDNNGISAYDYLKSLEKVRASHEDARLLYVAATRAKVAIHFFGMANTTKDGEITPPKGTFLEMLWPGIQTHFKQMKSMSSENEWPKEANASALASFVPKLIRLKPSSYVHLNSGHDVNLAEVSKVNANTSLFSGQMDSPVLASEIGTLTHLYLKMIADQGLTPWISKPLASFIPMMQHWFLQRDFSQEEATQASQQVLMLLRATLFSQDGQWVLGPHEEAHNEWSIDIWIQDKIETRIIDRTFVDDGIRWIIDYKTTSITPDATDAELKVIASLYHEQLSSYAELFDEKTFPIQKAVFFVSIGRLVRI